MPDMRPVLIGMNNPINPDPKYALWPSPSGCTGWRVWQMLSAVHPLTQREYADAFERRNMIDSTTWSEPAAARAVVGHLATLGGRRVVLFGAPLRRLFGFVLGDLLASPMVRDIAPRYGLMLRDVPGEASTEAATFYLLPHPSGRNLWYNNPANRLLAGRVLAGLLEGDRS